ncbi:MAG: hypothetical protein NTZ11_07620 [Gammaproteobacteria bacterium]|nr:hypothetical protein [Gammaproteobacteria bacterium]
MNSACRLAALLPMLAYGVQAAPHVTSAAPPSAPREIGTTIVGDSDAAIGLYLTPWSDEAPLPPSGSPANFTIEPTEADPLADRARSEALESIDSHRRARRQSYGN